MAGLMLRDSKEEMSTRMDVVLTFMTSSVSSPSERLSMGASTGTPFAVMNAFLPLTSRVKLQKLVLY